MILTRITKTKNIMPITSVALAMTFSGPRSFTLLNRFKPPLPVNALLIPSDLPPCNSERSINTTAVAINNISNILTLLSVLTHYNKSLKKRQDSLLILSFRFTYIS